MFSHIYIYIIYIYIYNVYIDVTFKGMSWLKLTLKRLGLKRRAPDANINTAKVIVTKFLRSSHNLRGYRSVWKIHKRQL